MPKAATGAVGARDPVHGEEQRARGFINVLARVRPGNMAHESGNGAKTSLRSSL